LLHKEYRDSDAANVNKKKKRFRWIEEKCILTKSIAHRKYAGNLRMNTCQVTEKRINAEEIV